MPAHNEANISSTRITFDKLHHWFGCCAAVRSCGILDLRAPQVMHSTSWPRDDAAVQHTMNLEFLWLLHFTTELAGSSVLHLYPLFVIDDTRIAVHSQYPARLALLHSPFVSNRLQVSYTYSLHATLCWQSVIAYLSPKKNNYFLTYLLA